MSTSSLELALLRRCIKKPTFLARAVKALKGYHFENWARTWIWRTLRDTFETHGEPMFFRLIARRAQRNFKDQTQLLEVVRELRKVRHAEPLESPNATLDEINKRLRLQRGTALAEDLVNAVEKGDADAVDKAAEKVEQLASTRDECEEDEGILVIAKRDILGAKKSDRGGLFVPTGMSFIDRRWRGVKIGELYLVAGVSGVGKSIAVTQAGAKTLSRSEYVLHVTTEMSSAEVTSRYVSRFTGIPEEHIHLQKLTTLERQVLERWVEHNWERMNRLLRIKRLRPDHGTLADVRATLRKRQRKGRSIKLLIIDSADHLKSGMKLREEREEITHIYRGLKSIADEFKCAVIAVTWVNKVWAGKIATKEAVSDNYEKTKQCDWFVSYNQLKLRSEEDQREGVPGTVPEYLYIGKRRSGESNILIPMVCDFARMRMDTAPEQAEEN